MVIKLTEEKILDHFNKDWQKLDFNETYAVLAIKVRNDEVDLDDADYKVGMLCQDEEEDITTTYIRGKLKRIFLYFTQNKEELKFYNIIETDTGKIYYPKYNDYMMYLCIPSEYSRTQEGDLYIDPYIEDIRLYLSDRPDLFLSNFN